MKSAFQLLYILLCVASTSIVGFAQTLSAITPNNAKVGSIVTVGISGQNLSFQQSTNTNVYLTNGPCTFYAATSKLINKDSITATFNINYNYALGLYDLNVQTATGLTSLTKTFTLNAQQPISIQSIYPTTCNADTVVKIGILAKGAAFNLGYDYRYFELNHGGSPIYPTNYSVINPDSIVVSFPLNANAILGKYDVTINSSLVGNVTLTGGFTITPKVTNKPKLISVSPDSAYPYQTIDVTISGQNTHFDQGTNTTNFWFQQGSSTIGGSCTVNSLTSATAHITVPANAKLGLYNLIGDGSIDMTLIDSNAFRIIPNPNPPKIVSVSPNVATPNQTISVTISGQSTYFGQGTATTSVWFNQGSSTINPTSVSIANHTQLTAVLNIPSNSKLGAYSVNVNDPVFGILTDTNSFTIETPLSFSAIINHNISCFGGNDGSSTIQVQGGTTPYTYSWKSGNQTGTNTNQLLAGTYSVTVTDSKGLTISTSFILTEPLTGLTGSMTPSPTTVNKSNGQLSVSVSGGSVPYTYLWSSGGTGTSINNLVKGNYSVTITDKNGCTLLESDSIISINPCANSKIGISGRTYKTTDSMCNGSIKAMVSGAVGNPIYFWTSSNNLNNQSSDSIYNLCAGNYKLTITDSLGCIALDSFIITTIPKRYPPIIKVTSVQQLKCYGDSDGQIVLAVTGGILPYSYSWSTLNGNGLIASKLTAGNYTFTVTDSAGLSAVQVISITGPISPLLDSLRVIGLSGGKCNGQIQAIVLGGTTPYTYSWSNYFNTTSISNLCSGTYSVTITDANGCNLTKQQFINGDTLQNTAYPVSIFVNTKNISKVNYCDGMVQTSVSGGTAPYTYKFSNDSSSANLNGLCEGNYQVTVTDHNGLTKTAGFIIAGPSTTIIDTLKGSNPLSDSTILATLKNNVVNNCKMLSLKIDSVHAKLISYLGTDSVVINWYAYHQGTLDSVEVHYFVNAAGVYTCVLQLACQGNSLKVNNGSANTVLEFISQVYVGHDPIISSVQTINKEDEIQAYPVPFENQLHLNIGNALMNKIELFDLSGRKVMEDVYTNGVGNITLQLNSVKSGTYLIKITNLKSTTVLRVIKDI